MTDGAEAVHDDAPLEDAVRRGVPPGSLRYFAVLFAGDTARPLLQALYAFEAELRRIVDASSHEAAHARLQWWRGEVDRLATGRASHPLATALLPLRDHRDADPALLHELLVAADLDLARITYGTWQELDAYLFRASGVLQVLAAATLAGSRGLTASEREFARRLGAAVRQVEMLCDLAIDVSRGRLYAPLAALDAAGVEPANLAQIPVRPDAASFLAAWRARVQAELAALPALLDGAAPVATQRHGLVLAALHARLLARAARAPAAPGARVELAPLTRLWTAWRTALRHT